MSNVYLIEQDCDHLYGEYVVSAVVIAESIGEAQKLLGQHLRRFSKDTGEEILCHQDRLSTYKIGNNGRLPNGYTEAIVCLQIGEDSSLPPGAYD